MNDGFPPLTIEGAGLVGGEIVIPTTLSSQYISALLQVGPYCRDGLTLRFEGPVTSKPYIIMTLQLMKIFGIEADVDPSFSQIDVPIGCYEATTYDIEPDASSASYFLATAALTESKAHRRRGAGARFRAGL